MNRRTLRTRLPLLGGAVVAALLLGACSTGGGAPTASASGSETPRSGGDLSFAVNGNITCLDIHQSAANISIHPARVIFDSLTDQDPDDLTIHPWLAESWEINDDATEYTFHLRDGVTFTDGTVLTADVVKANFDDIVNNVGAANGYTSYSYLDGYRESIVEDEHTVTVAFEYPNVSFLQATSTISLAIQAPATLSVPLEDRCQGELIGSGPFSISAFDSASGATLVRNDDYNWASELRNHQGAAYLDSITVRVIPEAAVRAGELLAGSLDIDPWVLDEDLPRLQAAGISTVQRVFPGQVITITPNSQRPNLQDENVRRAIGLAIDRDEVVSGVLTEHDSAATSLIASNTVGYEAIDAVRYDPDEANRLLDEAGWTLGADGVRVKDGQRLTLVQMLSTGTRQTAPVIELVRQQLLEVGVELDISQATTAQAAALQQSGEWDLKIGPYHRADGDIVRVGYSVDFQNGAKRAEASEIDELLAQQNRETDAAQRQETLTRAITGLIEGGYAFPVFEIADILAVASHVHDVELEASSRLQLYDAWVSED